jgi:hypothetical protein
VQLRKDLIDWSKIKCLINSQRQQPLRRQAAERYFAKGWGSKIVKLKKQKGKDSRTEHFPHERAKKASIYKRNGQLF